MYWFEPALPYQRDDPETRHHRWGREGLFRRGRSSLRELFPILFRAGRDLNLNGHGGTIKQLPGHVHDRFVHFMVGFDMVDHADSHGILGVADLSGHQQLLVFVNRD